jgi:hypothetical protein
VVVGVDRERRWRSPRLLGGLIVVKRTMKYEKVTRRGGRLLLVTISTSRLRGCGAVELAVWLSRGVFL